MITSLQLQQQHAAATLYQNSRSSCFPCFFGLTPSSQDGDNGDAFSPSNFENGSFSSYSSSILLRPLIIFVLWQLLAHLPFLLVGNAVAAGWEQLMTSPTNYDNVGNIESSSLPWYGIDAKLRVSTTVADVLRIGFYVLLGQWYKRNKVYSTLTTSTFSSPSNKETATETVSMGDYQSINDDCEHPFPSFWSSKHWWELAIWSTLAWPLRMGHTFEQIEGLSSSRTCFWVPLQAYSISRVAALAIGAIPGCIGGVPSLTTSFGLGLVYASYRDGLELELRMAAVEKAECDEGGDQQQQHLVEVDEISFWGRNSKWMYWLRNTLGYGYCTCFMVLWDALLLESVLAAEKNREICP